MRVCVFVCMCERIGMRECVYAEGERERVCVCVCVRDHVDVL